MSGMETDVLVIGGGATGGGLAWDLALRGVRVILAEMGDLATGTSGRYHGLLHSGGRYAVRDPESAQECIEENRIVRRIAPQAIEDTGGYFVLCPGDDESYVDQWLKACAAVNIPTRPVPLDEARRREPTLNPKLGAVYHVPDATCDSWDLLHALQFAAESTGRAKFLTYHRVDAFHRTGSRITGARLTHLRNNETVDITCAVVVNAAGPWAADLGAKAGVSFRMRLSRGAMLAYNMRWVNTVINKLRLPGDGDIFVPVGTVSVIGTTSVKTDDPGDVRVESWEVKRILDEAEAMTPGISRARILRAWGGVRPLYDGGSGDGRSVKRTFTTLDHAQTDGVEGLVSIIGGKLTTYRLMAERVADVVCAKLNVTAPCKTAETVLPSPHGEPPHLHRLRGRLDRLEHGETPGALICECEIVTAPQIEDALRRDDVFSLNDLRRDLRLGMGPCQGGFCSYRAAGVRHLALRDQPEHTRALLEEFVERRFGGVRPLLWGHNLRQALLAEHIYGRIIGLAAQPAEQTITAFPRDTDETALVSKRLKDEVSGRRPRVVIVGAGLAGLTAALVASQAGARVEVVAQGQGALTLHPGWIEIGAVEALSARADHPYRHAVGSLAAGLSALDRVIPLERGPLNALTALGRPRPVAYAAGGSTRTLIPGERVLVAGITSGGVRWRDFYAGLLADTLRDVGYPAEAVEIDLPHRGGNFDDWPLDYAHFLDTSDGLRYLIRQLEGRLNGAQIVALPAVLGFKRETRDRLMEALGVPVLEIPTLTPSVPGLRLYHALRTALLEHAGRVTIGPRVTGLALEGERVIGIYAETAAHGRARMIAADAVILATGGLFGGGLDSDYTGRVWETIHNLPVANVPPLEAWFTNTLLGGQPQPIHMAGLRTDADLRPLDETGAPAAANLYAAGRLLGGFSPVIEGSTEGVDIATGAHAALAALREIMTREQSRV